MLGWFSFAMLLASASTRFCSLCAQVMPQSVPEGVSCVRRPCHSQYQYAYPVCMGHAREVCGARKSE
eukprot:3191297-Rhodomonas_salina.1